MSPGDEAAGTSRMTQQPASRYEQPSGTVPLPTESRRVNLLRRLGSSGLLICAVLFILFKLPVWVFSVVVSCFVMAGLFEFFTMIRNRGILVNRPLGLLLGVLFCALVTWHSFVDGGLITPPIGGTGATLMNWLWDVFWPFAIISLCIRQVTRGNTFEAISGMATTLFGLAYIGALFSYFFYIRALEPEQGAERILYLLLVTKIGDVGAYAIGNLMGRHAFVPRISPRKTIEGFIGAILTSGVVAVAAQPLLGRPLAPVPSFLLGVFLGLFGQLGDLAESLIKRDCQVKDTGTLMPGLGGILDVVDSLLFTAPLFYAFLIFG